MSNEANTHSSQHTNEIIEQNVETIGLMRARAEQEISRHQRAIERFTAFVGRPATLYWVALAVVCWILMNESLVLRNITAPDPPPFYYLQGLIALGALMTALIVLTTQNRQMRHIEQRAHLDLQLNLAAEQRTAKIIALLEELRRDLPNVPNRTDSVAEAMTEAVDPHQAMMVLEETFDGVKPHE